VARKAIVVLACLALAFFLFRAGLDWSSLLHGRWKEGLGSLKAFVRAEGGWSYAAYLALFTALPILLVPVSLLCVAAGLAFEPIPAACLIWTGSLCSTVLTFFLGRFFGRGLVQRLLSGRWSGLKGWDAGAAKHGFQACLAARFLPIPFAVAGYAAGLSAVDLGSLLGATALAMLPWSIFYALFSRSLTQGSLSQAALVLGLLALLVVLGLVVRKRSSRGLRGLEP
jgi:uncharacterized membrane protein YdjX (TVP38/TMEM64 family)